MDVPFEAIFNEAPTRIEKLHGGDINDVFKVYLVAENYVVKVNRADHFPDMFKQEAKGLSLLRDTQTLYTPQVARSGELGTIQFLVLEFIPAGKTHAKTWQVFGEQLSAMHQNTSEQFGLEEDNYIGSLRQVNQPGSSWYDFYRLHRLLPMIELAVNQGDINYVEARLFDPLLKRLEELIPKEKPSLIHGDLWSGNYLINERGEPILIDPAVYFGHRETDLAMMQLFGGFPEQVFQSYHAIFPLEPGWQERKSVHQLYPLLIHLNLFGRSYWGQIKTILEHYL